MKRRKLQSTSLWGEESQVLSPLSFPFPGVTYFLALPLYCSLAQCPQLWSQNQPLPRGTPLCSYGCRYSGFSSREQELRYGVKEKSTAAAAWEDLLFLIPAPQQELTLAEPGLLESFVNYLMTQLLTHIAQQSCQAIEAAQMPWDKIQSLHWEAFPSQMELCVHSAVSWTNLQHHSFLEAFQSRGAAYIVYSVNSVGVYRVNCGSSKL